MLDPGCGIGDDALELAGYGCQVVALDLDPARVRQVALQATRLRLVGDIALGLPFQDETFDCVTSSLSLHYFTASQTERAFADIARILKPDGWFLCRVNAAGDYNFGYGDGVEVEPSLFRQPEGHLKRFFDDQMLTHFARPCFRLEQITPRVILQRGVEKHTLECLARKR